jgi:hypothetical protein
MSIRKNILWMKNEESGLARAIIYSGNKNRVANRDFGHPGRQDFQAGLRTVLRISPRCVCIFSRVLSIS